MSYTYDPSRQPKPFSADRPAPAAIKACEHLIAVPRKSWNGAVWREQRALKNGKLIWGVVCMKCDAAAQNTGDEPVLIASRFNDGMLRELVEVAK